MLLPCWELAVNELGAFNDTLYGVNHLSAAAEHCTAHRAKAMGGDVCCLLYVLPAQNDTVNFLPIVGVH